VRQGQECGAFAGAGAGFAVEHVPETKGISKIMATNIISSSFYLTSFLFGLLLYLGIMNEQKECQ